MADVLRAFARPPAGKSAPDLRARGFCPRIPRDRLLALPHGTELSAPVSPRRHAPFAAHPFSHLRLLFRDADFFQPDHRIRGAFSESRDAMVPLPAGAA